MDSQRTELLFYILAHMNEGNYTNTAMPDIVRSFIDTGSNCFVITCDPRIDGLYLSNKLVACALISRHLEGSGFAVIIEPLYQGSTIVLHATIVERNEYENL